MAGPSARIWPILISADSSNLTMQQALCQRSRDQLSVPVFNKNRLINCICGVNYSKGACKLLPGDRRSFQINALMLRYEVVRLDRTISNFYLNRSRATVGLNIAPSSTVIFKNYLSITHSARCRMCRPESAASLFGVSPLPHLSARRKKRLLRRI